MDDHDYDGLLVAVWTLAGGLFGGFGTSSSVVRSTGPIPPSVRRVVPARPPRARLRRRPDCPVTARLALELALWGDALFRRGGADAGSGGRLFEAIDLALLLWSACLLLIGVRTVHGWTWGRALAATAAPAALVAALLLL